MRNPPRRLLAVAAAALVVAGCAGTGQSNGRSTGSPASSAPSTSSPARTTSAPPAAPATTTPSPWHPPTIHPGTALPGEMISAHQAADLQESIDEGHQPWRVHPDMVAEAYVRGRFGWEDLVVTMTGPQTATVVNRPDGQRIVLNLHQPVREGPTGIWTVVDGTYLG